MKKSMHQVGLEHDKKTIVKSGFSIIEIIIVVVVIAILAGIVYVSYGSIVKSSDEESAKAAVQSAAASIQKYRADNGAYPASLDKAGVANEDSSLTYRVSTSTDTYCVSILKGDISMRVTKATIKPETGDCSTVDIRETYEDGVKNLATDPSLTVASTVLPYGAAGTAQLVTGTLLVPSTAHSGGTHVSRTVTAAGTGGVRIGMVCADGYSSGWYEPDLIAPYVVSAWLRPSRAVTVTVGVDWHVNGYGFVVGSQGGETGGSVTLPANQWTRVSYKTVNNSSYSCLFLRIALQGSAQWAAGDKLDIDSLMFTQGSRLYTYADGNSPDWSWTGTVNRSVSTGRATIE